MYDQFESNVKLPEIQREKQIMKEIHTLHRPIRRDELDDHERQYQENKRSLDKMKRMERERHLADIGYGVHYTYANKYLERVMEEERLAKKKKEAKSERKRTYHQKMSNYAKFVKEMHWPDISPSKKEEMYKMRKILSNKNKPLNMRYKENVNKHQTIDGPHTTGMVTNMIDHTQYENLSHAESAPNLQRKIKEKKRKVNWKFKNSMVPKEVDQRPAVVVDWLAERRAK